MGSADLFGEVLQDRNRDHDIEGFWQKRQPCQRWQECQPEASEDRPDRRTNREQIMGRTVTLDFFVVNALSPHLSSRHSSRLDPTGEFH